MSFARDTDYVLRIAWRSERQPELTVTRTYFQVRPSERTLSSEGLYEYQDNQTFSAQRYT